MIFLLFRPRPAFLLPWCRYPFPELTGIIALLRSPPINRLYNEENHTYIHGDDSIPFPTASLWAKVLIPPQIKIFTPSSHNRELLLMGFRFINENSCRSITFRLATVAINTFEAKSKRGETLFVNIGIAIFIPFSLCVTTMKKSTIRANGYFLKILFDDQAVRYIGVKRGMKGIVQNCNYLVHLIA